MSVRVMKKLKNSKKKKFIIYWPAVIGFSILIITFSCIDIFYYHVFEKWDKAEIIYVEETNDPASCKITYFVDGQIYVQKVSYYVNGNAPVPGTPGQGQYYIEYLVSNPSVCMYNRKVMTIIFTVADCFLIIIFVPALLLWNRELHKKRDKKLNSYEKETNN